MKQVKQDIQKYILEFIKAYEYQTPIDDIICGGIGSLRVLYKPDYFNKNHKYYKKGIGDIIVIFKSNYRIVIKSTVSGSWGFALLNRPYNVIEEIWILSEKQQQILPNLILSLEKGYVYRNQYSNLTVISQKDESTY